MRRLTGNSLRQIHGLNYHVFIRHLTVDMTLVIINKFCHFQQKFLILSIKAIYMEQILYKRNAVDMRGLLSFYFLIKIDGFVKSLNFDCYAL